MKEVTMKRKMGTKAAQHRMKLNKGTSLPDHWWLIRSMTRTEGLDPYLHQRTSAGQRLCADSYSRLWVQENNPEIDFVFCLSKKSSEPNISHIHALSNTAQLLSSTDKKATLKHCFQILKLKKLWLCNRIRVWNMPHVSKTDSYTEHLCKIVL